MSDYRELSVDRVVRLARSFARRHHYGQKFGWAERTLEVYERHRDHLITRLDW